MTQKEKQPDNIAAYIKATIDEVVEASQKAAEIQKYMKQQEKQLEDQCVTWARRHGWDAWKNENNGNKGIPDRSFLKGDVFIMVEFKRDAAAHIRPEQITWQRHHPATVFFIWSFEDFTELLTNKNPKQ